MKKVWENLVQKISTVGLAMRADVVGNSQGQGREQGQSKVKSRDEGGKELGSGDMNQVVKKMTKTQICKLQQQNYFDKNGIERGKKETNEEKEELPV